MGAGAFKLLAVAAAVAMAACTSINSNQATFDDTRWQVTTVSGQQTPRTHMYQVSFSNGRIAGRFGCNHVGGDFRVRGDVMTVTEVASTLIGCPEPAATHEARAFAVLGRPMRMNWASARRLTLTNEAGSIALERVPRQ